MATIPSHFSDAGVNLDSEEFLEGAYLTQSEPEEATAAEIDALTERIYIRDIPEPLPPVPDTPSDEESADASTSHIDNPPPDRSSSSRPPYGAPPHRTLNDNNAIPSAPVTQPAWLPPNTLMFSPLAHQSSSIRQAPPSFGVASPSFGAPSPSFGAPTRTPGAPPLRFGSSSAPFGSSNTTSFASAPASFRSGPPSFRPSPASFRPAQPPFRSPQPSFRAQTFQPQSASLRPGAASFRPSQPSFRPAPPSFQQNQTSFQPAQPSFSPTSSSFRPTPPSFGPTPPPFGTTPPSFGHAQPSFSTAPPSFRPTPPSFQSGAASFGVSHPSHGALSGDIAKAELIDRQIGPDQGAQSVCVSEALSSRRITKLEPSAVAAPVSQQAGPPAVLDASISQIRSETNFDDMLQANIPTDDQAIGEDALRTWERIASFSPLENRSSPSSSPSGQTSVPSTDAYSILRQGTGVTEPASLTVRQELHSFPSTSNYPHLGNLRISDGFDPAARASSSTGGSSEAIRVPSELGSSEKSRKAPRKRAQFKNAQPSNFCHICTHKSKLGETLITCSQLATGLCRKVFCRKCFDREELSWEKGVDSGGAWMCVHCRGECPARAQCGTYNKVNNSIREKRIRKKNNERHRRASHPVHNREKILRPKPEPSSDSQFGGHVEQPFHFTTVRDAAGDAERQDDASGGEKLDEIISDSYVDTDP